jgi:hypothetical protein
MYDAHSYEEQKMDKIRKKTYDIIQNEFDLSYLDISNKFDNDSIELIKNLTTLTKVCSECIQKKCAGGVNCKFGVYNVSLQICHDDMMNGKCMNKHCIKTHLTKRGFIPINKPNINKDKKKKKYYGVYVPKGIEINDDFFSSENYKNLISDSDFNSEMSSIDSSLDESIFD